MRKRNEDELDRIITQWTQHRDRWEITETLQRAGVAAFPTLSNKDLFEDPHLTQRGFIVDVEHPEVGLRKHSGICWRMSGTSSRAITRAPLLGEHTSEVLQSVLGYGADEIERLKAEGVLF
jgi:crotonobetainyl-CoA:carnitine CoA-transferase CaiB-like acyl-CoA transferase